MLESYGWSEELQTQFLPFATKGLIPGRVIVQQRGHYILATQFGDITAQISGRYARSAEDGAFPVAGDWVAALHRTKEKTATITDILPRSSAFIRKVAGKVESGQVMAANVDFALLVAPLNSDINARSLERFLATAFESGAKPVLVLTKADLCDDTLTKKAQAEVLAPGIAVHIVSAITRDGLDHLMTAIGSHKTAVLLGNSGAGKSSLLNAMAGQTLMATRAIREHDARGRHTTSHRELVLLPSGILLLDTPGIRELGLWNAETGVAATFDDIEELARQCRFSDCSHTNEPDCAVQAALKTGALGQERWQSYQKLQQELELRAKGEAEKAKALSKSASAQAKRKRSGPRRAEAEE